MVIVFGGGFFLLQWIKNNLCLWEVFLAHSFGLVVFSAFLVMTSTCSCVNIWWLCVYSLCVCAHPQITFAPNTGVALQWAGKEETCSCKACTLQELGGREFVFSGLLGQIRQISWRPWHGTVDARAARLNRWCAYGRSALKCLSYLGVVCLAC